MTSKRTVYKGVEIFYIDHVDCKKEHGLVLFAPDESTANIIKFSALMMQNVVATGRPALKNEYDRGEVNPMLDFGIEQDASANLLGNGSWFDTGGIYGSVSSKFSSCSCNCVRSCMKPKLCRCPCYPSKDV